MKRRGGAKREDIVPITATATSHNIDSGMAASPPEINFHNVPPNRIRFYIAVFGELYNPVSSIILYKV